MKQIVFIIFIFSAFFSSVQACSCVGESTVEGGVKAADFVAVGTVISKDIIRITDTAQIQLFKPDTFLWDKYPYTIAIAKYTIVIDELFKGKIRSDTISIYSGLGGGDCGWRFKVGVKYIIYGDKKTYLGTDNNQFNYPQGSNIFWTNLCTRTCVFDETEIAQIKKVITKN